jgi:transposase
MARHGLSDEQWERIEHLFPKRQSRMGRPPVDQRRVVDAILWVLRTGAPWRDLPEEFGKWQTVYHYFAKWRDDGTFLAVQQYLQRELEATKKLQHDLWSVDGTTIRATRSAAGGGKKRSRG